MMSGRKKSVISKASPHTIKKFELIEEYIKSWAQKLLLTESCNGLIFIDCMCNSGVYTDDAGQLVKGTAVRVSEALREASRTYTEKNIHIYLNDKDKAHVDELKKHLPQDERNFKIVTSYSDAHELLRTIGPQLYGTGHLHYFLLYDPYDATIDWEALLPFFQNWGEVMINHMVSDPVRAITSAKKKTTNLNVSTLTEDYMCRISKSYIVNIHSCLENFLKSFKHLPGSPTNITEIKKTSEDDWLEWTLNMAFSSIENDIKNDIGICEYYRLVRNCIVHSGESSSTLKSKRALIKTTDNPRLNAPNGLDSLTFDDQVLFSRAAYNVAKYIFNNSQYDVNAIIEANREILNDLIMPFQEPGSRSRATKKVKYFIGLSYPELKDVNWESVVSTLLN